MGGRTRADGRGRWAGPAAKLVAPFEPFKPLFTVALPPTSHPPRHLTPHTLAPQERYRGPKDAEVMPASLPASASLPPSDAPMLYTGQDSEAARQLMDAMWARDTPITQAVGGREWGAATQLELLLLHVRCHVHPTPAGVHVSCKPPGPPSSPCRSWQHT